MSEFSLELAVKGLFTVVSNVAILPAVVLAWRRREYDGCLLLFKLFWSSSLYHFCQSGFWCLFSFKTLRIVDYVSVFAAVSWMFLFVARVGPRWRGGLVVFIVMQLLSLQLQYGTRWYLALLGVATIGIPTSIAYAVISCGTTTTTTTLARDGAALLAAIVLAVVGFVFYFVEGEPDTNDTYPYTHGAWHVFAMFSLLALFYAGQPRKLNAVRFRKGLKTCIEI